MIHKIRKKAYFSIIAMVLMLEVLLSFFLLPPSWEIQEGEADVYAGYMDVSNCTSKDDFPHAGDGNLNTGISLSAPITGIDGGSLTIGSGKQLQLGPNVIFVFNPGESISPIGQVAFDNDAKIVKGYLWMKDADSDGCGLGLDDVTWTSSTTSPGADWRRIKDISYYPDPNDSSAGSAPGCTGCASHSYKSCNDNDVYWYDFCDSREDKYQECYSDSWTNNYSCSGNWRIRQNRKRGCSGSSCYDYYQYENWENCANQGKVCKNGACVASCSDQCSYSGQRACCNSSSRKTCGNYDSDSCLEWSSCSSCGSDRCSGTTWRDYYCTSNGSCTYRNYYNNYRCAPAVCPAKTCSQLGKTCGSWDNGCGKQINCGSCSSLTNKSCAFSFKCSWKCWAALRGCTLTTTIPNICTNGRCVIRADLATSFWIAPCCKL